MKHDSRNPDSAQKPEKPRRRAPMDKPPFPQVEGLKQNLRAAMAKPVSMEKVMELSGLALALHNAGAVADSYNTFAYAVNVARSLPERQREDALRLVRAEFRKTDMHMDCYYGLLRTCGAHSRMQDAS